MSHTGDAQSLHARCVDLLFAQTLESRPVIETVPRMMVAQPSAYGSVGAGFAPGLHPSQASPQEPPTFTSQADLQTAYEWFRAEKARLEAYTHSQFTAIHTQHQALLAKHVRSEEALAIRAQELNREI